MSSSSSTLSRIFVNGKRRVIGWKYFSNCSWSWMLAVTASSKKCDEKGKKAFLRNLVRFWLQKSPYSHGGLSINIFMVSTGKYTPIKLPSKAAWKAWCMEEGVPAAQNVWWEAQQPRGLWGQNRLPACGVARQLEALSQRWQQEHECYREGGFMLTLLLQATSCQQWKFQVHGILASWKWLQHWRNS